MSNSQSSERADTQENDVIQDTSAIRRLLEANFALPQQELENQQYSSFNEQIRMIKQCSMVEPGLGQQPDNMCA